MEDKKKNVCGFLSPMRLWRAFRVPFDESLPYGKTMIVPSLETFRVLPDPEKFVDDFSQELNAINDENNRRFTKFAMPRVALCAFLHGLVTLPTEKNIDRALSHHYSWCPANQWKQHRQLLFELDL